MSSDYWPFPNSGFRKALDAKTGELSLENDFLDGTLNFNDDDLYRIGAFLPEPISRR